MNVDDKATIAGRQCAITHKSDMFGKERFKVKFDDDGTGSGWLRGSEVDHFRTNSQASSSSPALPPEPATPTKPLPTINRRPSLCSDEEACFLRPSRSGPKKLTSCGSFWIGLIADIQYADRDDAQDYHGKQERHYRNALEITRNAVAIWNRSRVDIVVNLGDTIDGCNARLGQSQLAMATVLSVLDVCNVPRFDLIGNHELYNLGRADLCACNLRCFFKGRTYHSQQFGAHWSGIFLDAYDWSLLGVPENDLNYLEAEKIIRRHNPKVFTDGGDWTKDLPVELQKYVPFNGAISKTQLQWLEQELSTAESQKRRVLIFLHVPLYLPAAGPRTLVWNNDKVMKVLHGHRDTVVAVIAGHQHEGGYAKDPAGIHHVTMTSPMCAQLGTDCFAALQCQDNGTATFISYGRCCVETSTEGFGRSYSRLVLAKNAVNTPDGPAIDRPCPVTSI